MAKSSDKPNVTRIKANDNGVKKEKRSLLKNILPKKGGDSKQSDDAGDDKQPNALRRTAGYFKGSWQEIKLVRWPDRRSTWKMTGALIAFTVAFAVLILLLDYGFQALFKVLLGK